ncbi:hypothetical protein ACIA5H_34820 [Nocardia sp. NPDC051900]|uniref:hypothetical protein n=1 Tax=Nocardia sp. NPDC051900 TaxID=3364326 RepID=UPI0037B8573B
MNNHFFPVDVVLGYTSGGKPGDLQKIERFASLYALDNQKLPSGKWYIVNQFRERDPSTRRPTYE